jgi:hypothetical protein
MADVEKILRLVSQGVLTPEEADEILAATERFGREPGTAPPPPPEPPTPPTPPGAGPSTSGRHLRIEVSEGGKRVVNLRVPMNIAGWATAFLPGLSDEQADQIRSAMSSGERGPLLDIDDNGSRVVIISE